MACARSGHSGPRCQQDPEYNSSFTLDFGAYGMRTANITTTHYTLATDPVGHTAQFLTYHQTVDPLELPGGVSTGNITVTIQESQPGTYDPGTGVFTTHDTYLIYFDGNLSMFGLDVARGTCPGSAGGTITYDTPISGRIASAWTGQGELQNPYDPLHPIAFSYDCATHHERFPSCRSRRRLRWLVCWPSRRGAAVNRRRPATLCDARRHWTNDSISGISR